MACAVGCAVGSVALPTYLSAEARGKNLLGFPSLSWFFYSFSWFWPLSPLTPDFNLNFQNFSFFIHGGGGRGDTAAAPLVSVLATLLPGSGLWFINKTWLPRFGGWVGVKDIFSDSNNIFLWCESEDINKNNNKKRLTSKISVDSHFTFTNYAWLCALALLHRLLC